MKKVTVGMNNASAIWLYENGYNFYHITTLDSDTGKINYYESRPSETHKDEFVRDFYFTDDTDDGFIIKFLLLFG